MYMYMPVQLNATQSTFVTIGTQHLRLIHQVTVNGYLIAWQSIKIKQYTLLQILTPKTHHTLANYRTKVSKSLKLERLDQRKPISKVQMSSHNQFQLFGVRGQFTVGWDLFTIVGRSLLWTVAVTLYNNLNCPGFIFVRGTVYNYTGSISI